jgi:hypothetical protein
MNSNIMRSQIYKLIVSIGVLILFEMQLQTVAETLEFRGVRFDQDINASPDFEPISTKHPYQIPNFGYYVLGADEKISSNILSFDFGAELQHAEQLGQMIKDNPSKALLEHRRDPDAQSKRGYTHFETMKHDRRFVAYRRKNENLKIGSSKLSDVVWISCGRDKEIVCVIIFSKSDWKSRDEQAIHDESWNNQILIGLNTGINKQYNNDFKQVFSAIAEKYNAKIQENNTIQDDLPSSHESISVIKQKQIISANSDSVVISGCSYNIIQQTLAGGLNQDRTGLSYNIFSKPYYAIGIVNKKYESFLKFKTQNNSRPNPSNDL